MAQKAREERKKVKFFPLFLGWEKENNGEGGGNFALCPAERKKKQKRGMLNKVSEEEGEEGRR